MNYIQFKDLEESCCEVRNIVSCWKHEVRYSARAPVIHYEFRIQYGNGQQFESLYGENKELRDSEYKRLLSVLETL